MYKNVRIERSVLRSEIYVYNRFNERVLTIYDVDYWTITDPEKCVYRALEYKAKLVELLDMYLEKIIHCFVTNHLL